MRHISNKSDLDQAIADLKTAEKADESNLRQCFSGPKGVIGIAYTLFSWSAARWNKLQLPITERKAEPFLTSAPADRQTNQDFK